MVDKKRKKVGGTNLFPKYLLQRGMFWFVQYNRFTSKFDKDGGA